MRNYEARADRSAMNQNRPLLWRELAKEIPGRSNKDCRRRWWNSLADGTAKGLWSEEEDEQLMQAVRKYGTDWRRVAQEVQSRTPDQCSGHWSQVLDPEINHCDYTTNEVCFHTSSPDLVIKHLADVQQDELLLHEVLSHGTNWSAISTSHVPRRTTLSLKNRYATLRSRHENKNKDNNPEEASPLQPVSLTQNGALTQRDCASQRRVANKPRNGSAVDRRYSVETMSDKEDFNFEDDSEDEEDDDESGIDPSSLQPSTQSNSSTLTAADLMFPPTPGSWLGSGDQDKDFMALFSGTEVHATVPTVTSLEDQSTTAAFEHSYLPSKSPLYTDNSSYLFGEDAHRISAIDLGVTRGTFASC